MSRKNRYFPMFVDLTGEKIVVIGGGRIAQRRVETLLLFAADILVVAPSVTEELEKFSEEGKIQWRNEVYEPCCIQGARMVLAATNDPLCNVRVAEDCRKQGISVNVAHDKALCDFYFPAVVVRDELVAGITASGQDHRAAARARARLEEVLKGIDEEV